MSDKPTAKFQSFALLRATDQFPKGQPFTPIPNFFFEMWTRYCDDIPLAFWATFLFLLRETLGRTLTGVAGKVAQSQFPVDRKEARKWLAALTSYGGLIDVVKAKYRDTKGSEYTLNPEATEEQWKEFFALLALGCRLGYFSNASEPRPSVESITTLFEKWRKRPRHGRKFPFWSLMPLSTLANHDCGFAEAARTVDIWDDQNWIPRGFDMAQFQEQFSDASGADFYQFVVLFHHAWTTTDASADVPRIQESSLPDLAAMFYFTADTVGFQVEGSFTRVEIDGEGWLEHDWLTAAWRHAKEEAAMNDVLRSNPAPQALIDAEM